MLISINMLCTVGHMRDLHYITNGLSRVIMSFQWTLTKCWVCKENWNPGSHLWFRIFLHSFNIHIQGVIAIGQRCVSATCEAVMLILKKIASLHKNALLLHFAWFSLVWLFFFLVFKWVQYICAHYLYFVLFVCLFLQFSSWRKKAKIGIIIYIILCMCEYMILCVFICI